jgi:hypothetical protein
MDNGTFGLGKLETLLPASFSARLSVRCDMRKVSGKLEMMEKRTCKGKKKSKQVYALTYHTLSPFCPSLP